jgi:hypothetical protein
VRTAYLARPARRIGALLFIGMVSEGLYDPGIAVGPLLPIMTPRAWMLCTLSLRPHLRLVPAALMAVVGVSLCLNASKR